MKFDKETFKKIIHTFTSLQKLDTIMYEAQRQGRISFYMQNQGEVSAQIGSAAALDPNDLVFGLFMLTFVMKSLRTRLILFDFSSI
jgi:2-oxoisovalerate dehydrogenase E1 component alpha subunit